MELLSLASSSAQLLASVYSVATTAGKREAVDHTMVDVHPFCKAT